ncbi:hypothetical protein H2200_002042 [Cladophialophora chaetospira]|uniref:Uncharacterized protein n=1 Tax=Cladophialophora chaetospira TaxID=386627 RepID=A0AA38XI84_9EURO|nr:hypothetical protein H2200_002042 [Cladophialophora chaetospira]
MLEDIELGANAPVATPKKTLQRPIRFWPGAAIEADVTSAASTSADPTSSIQPNSERRRTNQIAKHHIEIHSRRSPEEINLMWRNYFSERVAAVNEVKKNGKSFDCRGFLCLCWQDDSDIEELASAVAVPIPNRNSFTTVEMWHLIRDQWLRRSGQWKRYSPFHRICGVSFQRAQLLSINPAGNCRILLKKSSLSLEELDRQGEAGYDWTMAEAAEPLRAGELLQLREGFIRSINNPDTASVGGSAPMAYSVGFLTQKFKLEFALRTCFIREEVQFTRTWAALLLTTTAIAVVVLVGLKVVFPSWETTFAAASYIATVTTIPVMVFISKLEKVEKPPSGIMGMEHHRKRE